MQDVGDVGTLSLNQNRGGDISLAHFGMKVILMGMAQYGRQAISLALWAVGFWQNDGVYI